MPFSVCLLRMGEGRVTTKGSTWRNMRNGFHRPSNKKVASTTASHQTGHFADRGTAKQDLVVSHARTGDCACGAVRRVGLCRRGGGVWRLVGRVWRCGGGSQRACGLSCADGCAAQSVRSSKCSTRAATTLMFTMSRLAARRRASGRACPTRWWMPSRRIPMPSGCGCRSAATTPCLSWRCAARSRPSSRPPSTTRASSSTR